MPWLDPNFDQVIRADLLVVGNVTSSTPLVTHVQVEHGLAGAVAGQSVAIYRAPILGRGHENDTAQPGRYLFVGLRRPDGQFAGITDSYWHHPFSDPERIYMGIRDPFTRSHVPLATLADVVASTRDRAFAIHTMAKQLALLEATPVAATQPFEVHTQIIALEIHATLWPETEADARACARFLASPHYQVRWSAARAAAALTDVLVDHLMREDAPPVQSSIVDALRGRITAAHVPALRARLPALHDEDILLSKNIMNPAFNKLRSPRHALAELLG